MIEPVLSRIADENIKLCESDIKKRIAYMQKEIKTLQMQIQIFEEGAKILRNQKFKEDQWVQHSKHGIGFVYKFTTDLNKYVIKFKKEKNLRKIVVLESELSPAIMAGTLFE